MSHGFFSCCCYSMKGFGSKRSALFILPCKMWTLRAFIVFKCFEFALLFSMFNPPKQPKKTKTAAIQRKTHPTHIRTNVPQCLPPFRSCSFWPLGRALFWKRGCAHWRSVLFLLQKIDGRKDYQGFAGFSRGVVGFLLVF